MAVGTSAESPAQVGAAAPAVGEKAATPAVTEPPPEKASDIKRRTSVVVSFWSIVLLLGLPIWWYTTSIYRANLPTDDMLQWADGKVGTPNSFNKHG
jgi:GPI-anchor transamidase subunit S